MAPTKPRTKVFVSYSHKDKRWLDELRVHLKLLDDEIDAWEDNRLGSPLASADPRRLGRGAGVDPAGVGRLPGIALHQR
jgi:hypothetical protein